MATTTPELYQHDQLVATRQLLKLFGASFRIRTTDGRLLAFSRQKAFRLREDIRVYADENESTEILWIQADRVVDWSASYRVVDSQSGECFGSLRRKGWTSMLRDTWEIVDPQGQLLGRVLEDSSWKAMLRRVVDWAAIFLPQTYMLQVDGETVATMRQNFLGIPPRFHVDLSIDRKGRLPRPLAVATVILLLAIEGRQHSFD